MDICLQTKLPQNLSLRLWNLYMMTMQQQTWQREWVRKRMLNISVSVLTSTRICSILGQVSCAQEILTEVGNHHSIQVWLVTLRALAVTIQKEMLGNIPGTYNMIFRDL